MRRVLIAPLAGAAVLVLTGAQGGCGGPGSSGGAPATTVIQEKGAPSPLKCDVVLTMHPEARQLIASLIVTCNFPVYSATSSLVIQGRPAGSGAMSWDNVGDPRQSESVPPVVMVYKYNCVAGYEFQASAQIDGVSENGVAFHDNETTPGRVYTAAECS